MMLYHNFTSLIAPAKIIDALSTVLFYVLALLLLLLKSHSQNRLSNCYYSHIVCRSSGLKLVCRMECELCHWCPEEPRYEKKCSLDYLPPLKYFIKSLDEQHMNAHESYLDENSIASFASKDFEEHFGEILDDLMRMFNLLNMHIKRFKRPSKANIRGANSYPIIVQYIGLYFNELIRSLNDLQQIDVVEFRRKFERLLSCQKELNGLLVQEVKAVKKIKAFLTVEKQLDELVLNNKVLRLQENEVSKKLAKVVIEYEKLEGKLEMLMANQKAVELFEEKTAELEKEIKGMKDSLHEINQPKAVQDNPEDMEMLKSERKKLKAALKEIPIVLEDLNTKLHHKEAVLGNQRKNINTALKSERDKILDVDLLILQTRYQNINGLFEAYMKQRENEISRLHSDRLTTTNEDKHRIIQTNIVRVISSISSAKKILEEVNAIYKNHISLVQQGNLLITLPEIIDPYPPTLPELFPY